MKALVLTGTKQFDLVDRSAPVPFEGEVILRVLATAICRTDAKMWHSGHRDLVMPRVMGHEVCGTLEEDPERLFVVWPGTVCGACRACRSGRANLCPAIRITGFHRDGGFGEFLAVQPSSLLEVPQGLSASMATLAEPLACAMHAIGQVRLQSDARVLVYGAGTLGLLLSLAAKDRGAHVFISDPDARKLARSRAFRTRYAINADEVASSSGFDVIFNAASPAETLTQGIDRLASGGRFCLFSGLGGEPEQAGRLLGELHYRELELVGSYGCTAQDMRHALQLLARYGNHLEFLLEDRIALEEVPSVIEDVLAGKGFRQVITMDTRNHQNHQA